MAAGGGEGGGEGGFGLEKSDLGRAVSAPEPHETAKLAESEGADGGGAGAGSGRGSGRALRSASDGAGAAPPLARQTTAAARMQAARTRFRAALAASRFTVIRPTFFCQVCFENVSEDEAWRPAACENPEHKICRSCAKDYVRESLLSGSHTDRIACPAGDGDCRAMVVEADVVDLDGEDGAVVERFRRFAKKETGKYVECPKDECRHQNHRPMFGNWLECENCGSGFCAEHGLAHGKNETCASFLSRTAHEHKLSSAEIAKTSVKCPGCFRPITRSTGCCHMTCNQCGCEFCYLCGCATPAILVESHYADFNCFGCPGQHFSSDGPNSREHVWWINLFVTYPVQLISLPFLLVFAIAGTLCTCTLAILCCPCIALFLINEDVDSEALLIVAFGTCGPFAMWMFLLVATFPWLYGCCQPCYRMIRN